MNGLISMKGMAMWQKKWMVPFGEAEITCPVTLKKIRAATEEACRNGDSFEQYRARIDAIHAEYNRNNATAVERGQ